MGLWSERGLWRVRSQFTGTVDGQRDCGAERMSVRMHRSSDGMMRPCDAKTTDSCRAVAPDGSPAKHYMFDSPQAANQWNSLAVAYSSTPRAQRRSEPAIALLTAMSDLQNGGEAASAQEVARLLEAASVQQAGSHNFLGKTPLDGAGAGGDRRAREERRGHGDRLQRVHVRF